MQRVEGSQPRGADVAGDVLYCAVKGDEVEARAVVGDLDLVPVDRAVQDVACDIGAPGLRTLDALHLASALLLGEAMTAFVTYDHRLADAARAAGLGVATPGQAGALTSPT